MNRYKFNYEYELPMAKTSVVIVAENVDAAWEKFARMNLPSSTEVSDIENLGKEEEVDPRQLNFFSLVGA